MQNRKGLFIFNKKTVLVLIILFIIAFLFTGLLVQGINTIQLLLRLADAFLNGRLYLLDNQVG